MLKTHKGHFRVGVRQKGTVLVTVLLVVAFVVILVVEVSKTVNYQTSLNRNLMNRDQAYSYLIGMEELAKVYLKKGFDAEKEDIVHLGQPWAQEDITFPIDGGGMVATIRDMQSCFNINSMNALDGLNTGNPNNPATPSRSGSIPTGNTRTSNNQSNNQGNVPQTISELTLTTLLEKVLQDTEVQPSALVAALKDWTDSDLQPNGPDGVEDSYYQGLDIPYLPPNGPVAHVSELRTIRYFDKKSYQQLRPYICVLPDDKEARLNVNTIPPERSELLFAALGGAVSQSEIDQLISERPESGYEIQEFWDEVKSAAKVDKGLKARLIATSQYFQMDAKAEINQTRVYLKTLFVREDKNNFKVVSRYFGKE